MHHDIEHRLAPKVIAISPRMCGAWQKADIGIIIDKWMEYPNYNKKRDVSIDETTINGYNM